MTPLEPWPNTPAGLRSSPGQRRGGGGEEFVCGSLWRQGHWWQRPQVIFIGVNSSTDHYFDAKLGPPDRLLVASGQTTNRV